MELSEKKNALKKGIEKLSESLVFVEVKDLRALADIHTQCQECGQLATELSQELVAAAFTALEGVLESIILEEAKDPSEALNTISQTVSAIQGIIVDDRPIDEVEWPPQLGLDIGGEGGGVFGSFELPANVDEAIFSDFINRQSAVLEEMEELVLFLEKDQNEEKFGQLRRLLHTVKGESAMLGLADVERLCHATEDALNECPVDQMVDSLLSVRDWLDQTYANIRGEGPSPVSLEEIVARLPLAGSPPAPTQSAPASSFVQVEDELDIEPLPLSADPDLLSDFIAEANEHLEACDVHLLTLETNPHDEDAINAVFRAFHTIKGVSGFLELNVIGALAHEAENLLDLARKKDITLAGSAIDVTFESVDALNGMVKGLSHALTSGEPLTKYPNLGKLLSKLKAVAAGDVPVQTAATTDRIEEEDPAEDQKLGDILVRESIITSEDLSKALELMKRGGEKRKLGAILIESVVISSRQIEEALRMQSADATHPRLGEVLVKTGMLSAEEVEAALSIQKTAEAPKLGETLVRSGMTAAKDVAQALRKQSSQRHQTVQVKESVKVDADRLDHLVEMIGEMVIAESMVTQSSEITKNCSAQMQRQLSLLDKITRELQEMGTTLRMVPVKSTFQKMARLVRDLAKKSGKQVEFAMNGEDTELDKTVVDKIGDPLVHMVRNAVDHGLEASAEDRRQAGKSEVGRVELRAFHQGGNIFVEVRDDGRGLDRDAIYNKAVERGVINEGDTISDREVYNLIFEPGFSTAKVVTDVSGRGVGMDVVRKNIESLRGQVEIQSEKGKGSTFRIRLPLTLAIIDGMIVRVGKERYIIPTLSIVRSIRPTMEDINTVVGQGEMLTLKDELIPIHRLANMFGIEDAKQDITQAVTVVVENGNRHVGLVTDELLGQQQIVIKSMGEMLQGLDGISGGAIMPDGTVGLILDINGLIKSPAEAIVD
jgi:two-component system, chemotaxis family, sensor kinase CheA